MPSKKKKYNARFPAGRIKKIMQTDEEVGKVAQAVPVIISRTLELFVESLLTKSMQITMSRNARTLTPSHMKQCILSESRFDFLKDLVKSVPDASVQEDNENNEALDYSMNKNTEETNLDISKKESDDTKSDVANLCEDLGSSTVRTAVIHYGPKVIQTENARLNFSLESLVNKVDDEPEIHIDLTKVATAPSQLAESEVVPVVNTKVSALNVSSCKSPLNDNIPPLIPISHNYYGQNTSDALYIDEDYDN